MFNSYLRTFRGVNNSPIADVQMFVGSVEIAPPNVSAVNQTLRFTLPAPIGLVQGPFDVVTVRFDSGSRVIAAETVIIPSGPYHGHPLYGWRYWKVFQREPGKIAVETGALSRPALELDPIIAAYRWAAFGFDAAYMNQELTLWKDMLEDVNTGLNPAPGSTIETPQSFPELIQGRWNWMDKRYILQNICGDVAPFSVPLVCK